MLALALATVHAVSAQQLGTNLLFNGGFEEQQDGQPAGWTKTGQGMLGLGPGLNGNASLKLTVRAQTNETAHVWALSQKFSVTPGKHYLLVFSAKTDIPYPKGSDSQIYWYFQNAQGQGLPQQQEWYVPVSRYYCRNKWQIAHYLVTAPTGAVTAQISTHLVTTDREPEAVLYLDGLRITEYTPPAPGEKSQFYAAATYGVGGEMVEDTAATTRRAWQVTKTKHAVGGKISGPLIMDQAPGLYRATYRLKVADNTSPKRVVYLHITGDELADTPQTTGLTLLGTDFRKAGEYQEFSMEFIRSPLGGLQYLVTWYGTTDMTLDGVTIRQEKILSDADWVNLYGLSTAAVQIQLGNGVLLCRGLNTPSWKLDAALAGTQTVTQAWLYTGAGGVPRLDPPFPLESEGLKPYRLVILADVPPESLGFLGRRALRDFVASGGGLLVLGGFHALGAGGVQRSFLEDLLPVTVGSVFDLCPCKPPTILKPARRKLFSSDVKWDPAPVCLWQNTVQTKEEAKVIIKAGDMPFLIVGSYGKGRVAVCTGTVLGQAPKGTMPFWEWKDWPEVISEAIDYLSQRRKW
ncbi:MAG: hypothetical protein KKD33_09395 [Verrucomicrobia bacterium]|nr:hypothetical protein [Verrucomicrobiota bacterium]